MHYLDLIVVAGIALAIFGPKTLQSLARNMGKGAAQARHVKDEILSTVPLDTITKVTDSMPQIPLNSRQALQMLLASSEKRSEESTTEPLKEDKPVSSVVQSQTKPVESL